MANNYKIKMKDIQNKYKFKIFCAGYEYDDTELRNEISQRALISEAGRYVELELNPNTYVLTAKLKDKNNNVISTSTPIDLPLESMIVDCDYDATTKSLIITLQNGNTISIPLSDLISGLVTEEQLDEVKNELDATKEELNQYKTLYNVLPKVEGNGESITLNDTGESILKLSPRGQCKQDSTTGKNLVNVGTQSFTTAYQATNLNIPAGTYTFSAKITSSDTSSEYSRVYFYDENGGSNGSVTLTRGTRTSQTVTTTAATTRIVLYSSVDYANSNGKTATYENVQLETGSSMTDYEPYTNGASPNPSYPQEIHEVSGDNTINVTGKNLASDIFSDYSTIVGAYRSVPIKLEQGKTYTLKANRIGELKTNLYNYGLAKDGYSFATFVEPIYAVNYNSGATSTTTITIDSTYTNPVLFCYCADESVFNQLFTNYEIQLEEGGSATDYVPYVSSSYQVNLGNIKMRGIGSYEDYFVRNSGKNLFTNGIYNQLDVSGNAQLQSNGYYEVKFSSNKTIMEGEFEPNTQYTISCMAYGSASGNSGVIGFNYTDNTSETKGINQTTPYNYSITSSAGKTIKNIKITYGSQNTTYIKNIQLEKGSVATTYEPYGTGQWCKYNAIGEMILNGSQSVNDFNYNSNLSTTDYSAFFYVNTSITKAPNDTTLCVMCNKLIGTPSNERTSNKPNCWLNHLTASNLGIHVPKEIATTSDLKTWLSNNNLIFDIVLATPYLSLIESNTLIEQLDKLERALGKDGQTNISQVNNDAPFKIYASAVKDLSSL